MSTRGAVLGLALFVFACGGSTSNYSPKTVDTIHIGDSKKRVIKKLGEPSSATSMKRNEKNCTQLATWIYLGGKSGAAAVVVMFDDDDRVCDQPAANDADGSRSSPPVDASSTAPNTDRPTVVGSSLDTVFLKNGGRIRGRSWWTIPRAFRSYSAQAAVRRPFRVRM